MSWILIAILAAAMNAGATMFNKYALVKISDQPVVQVIFGGLVGAVLSNVIVLFQGHDTLSFGHALIALAAGVLFGLSITGSITAVKYGTVSQVVPLRFLAPVLTALIATLFLGETLAPQVYLGIVLVLTGALLLDGGKLSEIHLNKVLGLMLFAGLMMAIMQTLSKYLLQFSDPYTVFFYVRLGLLLFAVPLLIKHFGLLKDIIRPAPAKRLTLLIVPGILGSSAVFLVILAAETGPITVVSALAALVPFFSLLYVSLIGRRLPHIYTDGLAKVSLLRKLLLTSVMFAGVLLVL